MKNLMVAVFMIFYAKVRSETPSNNVTATYDPAELLRKIFKTNETILPRANYGLVQFEGQIPQPDFVNFEVNSNPEGDGAVKFGKEYQPSLSQNVQNVVKFEDITKEGTRKKKRRKRKPKQHYGPQNPGNLPYSPGYPEYPGNPEFYPPPTYGGQYYRPRRPRPRPSLASEALSAVTGALSSIALYDDYQCVPRLLCEAAAGGALGSSGILQTVSGLQPLLTLLSAYSGVTSNPLFVFGRAVLLGASSSSNPAPCRYAYTHCPTDPEQLVHYLNNYNGGFFRFFSSPQHGQQNVQQFYDQLSQNYGQYQLNQEYDQHNSRPNYGFQNNQQDYGFHNPNLYSNYDQNYGVAYPYQNNNQNIRFKNHDDYNINRNRIEKRIQNNPNTLYINDSEDENPRWTFPEGNKKPVHYVNNEVFRLYGSNDNNFDNNDDNYYDQNDRNRYHNDHRKGKVLKFPGVNNEDDYLDANYDKNRGSFFPENHNYEQHLDYNNPTRNNHDNKYYDNQQQYLNYNTPAQNNNYYDSKYDDNSQYSNYNNYASNNKESKYQDNRFNSDYDSPITQNFDGKYVNRDEYYANQYYANKNKYHNDNYANKGKYYNYNNDDYGNNNKYNYLNDQAQGVRTVYVIRGNGDPNNPEIHKLRPGQTVP